MTPLIAAVTAAPAKLDQKSDVGVALAPRTSDIAWWDDEMSDIRVTPAPQTSDFPSTGRGEVSR